MTNNLLHDTIIRLKSYAKTTRNYVVVRRKTIEEAIELLKEKAAPKEQDYRSWLISMFHKYKRDDLISLLVLYGEENLLKMELTKGRRCEGMNTRLHDIAVTLEKKITIAENNGHDIVLVSTDALKSILFALKEHESANVEWNEGTPFCGNCGHRLEKKHRNLDGIRCHICGMAVKWK